MILSQEAIIAWIILIYLVMGFATFLMAGIAFGECEFAIVLFWFVFIIPITYKIIKMIFRSTAKGFKKAFKTIYRRNEK